MSSVTTTISGANEFTESLQLRGSGLHYFGFRLKGTFAATITIQAKKPDDSDWVDLESHTDQTVRTGQIVGSWDLRAGCKTGEYTSGSATVELNK